MNTEDNTSNDEINQTPNNSPISKKGRPRKYNQILPEIQHKYNQTYYMKNVKGKSVNCDICNKSLSLLAVSRHNKSKHHRLNIFLKQELTKDDLQKNALNEEEKEILVSRLINQSIAV